MPLPALLVHPPLPAFEAQVSDRYEIVHWPSDRTDATCGVTVGHTGIPNEAIDAMPGLKTIVCFGVGVDGLDLTHCKACGIAITHGPNMNQDDVAELAIGLMIATLRQFTLGERYLREGNWRPPVPVPPRRRLRGQKLGIVGMGAIGRAIAARAAPFGVEIKWHGPRAKPDVAYAYEPSLLALAEWCDILILSVRAGTETENIIDARILEAIGGEGLLINVSRGSVVDEDALIAALKSGTLGGAGLDVFVEEPTPAERWRDVPNVTLLPHLGGNTRDALIAGVINVSENVRRHFAGEPLLTPYPV